MFLNQQNITSAEPDDTNPSASREPPDAAGDGPDGKDHGKTSSDPEGSVHGVDKEEKQQEEEENRAGTSKNTVTGTGAVCRAG